MTARPRISAGVLSGTVDTTTPFAGEDEARRRYLEEQLAKEDRRRPIQKACENPACGKTFTARSERRRFCSYACTPFDRARQEVRHD